MQFTFLFTLLFTIPFFVLIVGGGIYLLILLIRALRKYLSASSSHSKAAPEDSAALRPLGDVIRDHRTRCGMTQEFVAERLGVSRQAVSKWEQGKADPSTSNLLALAKLFCISPEELLRCVK